MLVMLFRRWIKRGNIYKKKISVQRHTLRIKALTMRLRWIVSRRTWMRLELQDSFQRMASLKRPRPACIFCIMSLMLVKCNILRQWWMEVSYIRLIQMATTSLSPMLIQRPQKKWRRYSKRSSWKEKILQRRTHVRFPPTIKMFIFYLFKFFWPKLFLPY